MTEQEIQAKEALKKYLSDFDNLSETGFFSSAFIDDSVFYHKGLMLFQFLQVGREFIREYSVLSEIRKPSESLVKEIAKIMEGKAYELYDSQDDNTGEFVMDAINFKEVAQEIANLAPFNQNAEKEMTDKALKFAEWTGANCWTYCDWGNPKYWVPIEGELHFTTEELYKQYQLSCTP